MRSPRSPHLLFLFALACGEEPNLEKRACETLKNGPEVVVTAGDSFATPGTLASDGRRYLVRLSDIGGSLGGFVRWTVPQNHAQLILFNEELPVKFFVDDMVERPPATRARMGRCPEIKARYEFPAGIGTLTLQFQPTNRQAVGIVIADAP